MFLENLCELVTQLNDVQAMLNESHELLEEAAGETRPEAIRERLRKADGRINEAVLWINEVKRLWPALNQPEGGSTQTGTD